MYAVINAVIMFPHLTVKCMPITLWSVLVVDRQSRTKEQKITSGRSPFT